MLKKWLLGAAIIGAVAVGWNEYRLWNKRSQNAPMQTAREVSTNSHSRVVQTTSRSVDEESDAPPIIDLTSLQRQTSEPLLIEMDELPPASFDTRPMPFVRAQPTLPAQFLRHSADCNDGDMGKVAQFWKKLTGFVWGVSPTKPNAALIPEVLAVMPRPYSDYHRDHPTCPFPGNTSYRFVSPFTSGGEEQSAPPRKPLKVDTMEVRPSDLPRASWFSPF